MKLYHPELFRNGGDSEDYHIIWLEDDGKCRWRRMRLEVPKAHGDQLSIWSERALYLYTVKRQSEAKRIDVDDYSVGRPRTAGGRPRTKNRQGKYA